MRGWQRAFEDPIELPNGRVLVTPRDAATFTTKLPKKGAAEPEWQTAIETLMRAAERGWLARPRRDDAALGRHLIDTLRRGDTPAKEPRLMAVA